jgi:hypothetical protein
VKGNDEGFVYLPKKFKSADDAIDFIEDSIKLINFHPCDINNKGLLLLEN